MSRAMRIHLPARPLPALALLLAALAALLCRPAAAPAKAARSACSTTSAGTKHVRACAGRAHSGRSHAKAKGHRSGHRHRINKKKSSRHSSGAPATAALTPATCEDGSRPHSEGEGTFSCGDGSEPVCTSGAEPLASSNGARLVCPAPAAGAVEWNEAECADGSDPESSAEGDWACEDGSPPACPEGTAMTPSEDDSTLLCVTHGASFPPSEQDEGEAEDDVSSARVETAS
jgi:hypothetical protein